MKAVLDTNVIVSAVLSSTSSPRLVLEAWRDGRFELVASPLLLDELRRVLEYPKLHQYITAHESDQFLALIAETAQIVADPDEPHPVNSPDPDDDYLIALAAASRSVLVTGDTDLLGLSTRIPVFTPAGFLDVLESEETST